MHPEHPVEDNIDLTTVADELPVFGSVGLVPFPGVLISSDLDTSSERLPLHAAAQFDGFVLCAALHEGHSVVSAETVCHTAVLGKVLRLVELADGRMRMLLQGFSRVRLVEFRHEKKTCFATYEVLAERYEERNGAVARLMRDVLQFVHVLVERECLPEELLLLTEGNDRYGDVADMILAHLSLEVEDAIKNLEECDPFVRLQLANDYIAEACNKLLVAESVQERVKERLQKTQREYYLREQIRQIQDELGTRSGAESVLHTITTKIEKAQFSSEARQEARKQLRRLERLSEDAAEYSLIHTYLDWLCEVPWGKKTRDKLNPVRAERILNQDHYGLDKAKERILEYLCVRRLNRNVRGPILCFVGPPGVGKTSLGRSVAKALGKRYCRISLGGVRDEAEIRGHRRTYLGAMPGRVVQALKNAGSMNPVIVLDEIDKLGTDFRGDPSSALLEVLDPQQNKEFSDHYLSVSVDLSGVLFVATANTIDGIPDALLDRLEIIQVPGYTLDEKIEIARRFILPQQITENGLQVQAPEFGKAALGFVIERYTEEAGVRNLEREIASLCRKIARKFVEEGKVVKRLTPTMIESYLGPTQYDPEERQREDTVGLAIGLAWTVNGGELMPVEVSVASGSGVLTMTGQLGAVMQESAQAAVSFARAQAKNYRIDPDFYNSLDIHIHVPAGGTPKDGPSAGVTVVAALISELTKRPVSCKVAMTGELTLRGNLLPVGGLREKLLAAQRAGIELVIIPKGNEKELGAIDTNQLKGLEVVVASNVSEALPLVLVPAKGSKKRR